MPEVADYPKTHWFLDEIRSGRGEQMVLGPYRQMAHGLLDSLVWRPDTINPQWSLEGPLPGHLAGPCSDACADLPEGRICFAGSLLRFTRDDYTAVWRVQRYDHTDCETWHLAWPD